MQNYPHILHMSYLPVVASSNFSLVSKHSEERYQYIRIEVFVMLKSFISKLSFSLLHACLYMYHNDIKDITGMDVLFQKSYSSSSDIYPRVYDKMYM